MSPTFTTASSLPPSRSSDADTSASTRYARFPPKYASPTSTPFTFTRTWWSCSVSTASEPPWRCTPSLTGCADSRATPSSVNGFTRTTPDAIPSHSQMSGASNSPGWYTRFVSKEEKPVEDEMTGVPSGAADATPIRTPVPRTSSYATSPEYSVEPGVRSA